MQALEAIKPGDVEEAAALSTRFESARSRSALEFAAQTALLSCCCHTIAGVSLHPNI